MRNASARKDFQSPTRMDGSIHTNTAVIDPIPLIQLLYDEERVRDAKKKMLSKRKKERKKEADRQALTFIFSLYKYQMYVHKMVRERQAKRYKKENRKKRERGVEGKKNYFTPCCFLHG